MTDREKAAFIAGLAAFNEPLANAVARDWRIERPLLNSVCDEITNTLKQAKAQEVGQ